MTSYPGSIYPAVNEQREHAGDVDMTSCEKSDTVVLEGETSLNSRSCFGHPQNASEMLKEAEELDLCLSAAAPSAVQVVKDPAAHAEMKQDPGVVASDTNIDLLDVRVPMESSSSLNKESLVEAAEDDADDPQMNNSSAYMSSTLALAGSSSPPSSVIFDVGKTRDSDVDLAGSDEEWGAYTSPPPSEDALKCADASNDMGSTLAISTVPKEDISGCEDLNIRDENSSSTALPDDPQNGDGYTALWSNGHAEETTYLPDTEPAPSTYVLPEAEAVIETTSCSVILTGLSVLDATSNAMDLADSLPRTGSPMACLAVSPSPVFSSVVLPTSDVVPLPLKYADTAKVTPPGSPLERSSPLPASSLPASPSPAAFSSLDENSTNVSTVDSSVPGFLIPPLLRSSSLFADTEKRVEDDAQQEYPLDVDEDMPLRIMSSPGPLFLRDEPMLSLSPIESDTILGKRPGSPHEGKGSELSGRDRPENTPIKRLRREGIFSSPPRPAPAPKRATLASQKLSHRKLATPFRSPLMARPVKPEARDRTIPPTPGSAKIDETNVNTEASTSRVTSAKATHADKPNVTKTMTTLALASKAASQFRYPFAAGNVPSDSRNAILPTQTIQALERKLTALRRAVKIKADDDEEKLGTLALKWREAGREAAYEFWSIVRDIPQEDGAGKKDSGWAGGWGYDDGDKVKKEDDHISLEIETEKAEETLGLMLRRLGIDPETLGWNEEQEIFLDD